MSLTGSSPPVRGAHIEPATGVGVVGLIPACAGSTPHVDPGSRRCRAHPRLCGEHVLGLPGQTLGPGSSPPVRGAPHWSAVRDPGRGLIPACAGSTSGPESAQPSQGAHPRLCGEHASGVLGVMITAGSSPPVRGALRLRQPQVDLDGLIPACAGSTRPLRRRRPRCRAHPRLCGEHHTSICK